MRRLYPTLLVAACLALSLTAGAQGVTTASMFGRILDTSGEPLIGANVAALHEPSGTLYGNSTDLDGYFRIPGMRVGGPYTVTVSYTGYDPLVTPGISLALGERFQYNAELSEAAVELEGVEVVSDRASIFSGDRTGQETVIDEETIEALPTITRSLADFTRFNPLANIREDDDGFAVSLGGQNERFNTLYIDGAVNNDVFGLSDSGTNGGQTGAQPISIDAIEQFVVSVAPFDVRQSGFAGGAINAVTRSGTNDFEGSAYWLTRSENFTRNEAFTNDEGVAFDEIPEFSANTFGARFGGPIVKDKVFFFVNAEFQRDDIPQPFALENYEGSATAGDIDNLRQQILEGSGYDLGPFGNNTSFLDSDKFLAKLDFNLNESNKLSLRHSYVGADNLEARGSSNRSLNFLNGSEFFVSRTNSTALELNTLIGNTMSNNLTITGTFVRDDRDQFGGDFPQVDLQDGEGSLTFGGERFSSANLLDQDAVTINNDFQLFRGKHNLLFGFNFEYFSAANLFIRENFGRYQYDDQTYTVINGTDTSSLDLTGLQRFTGGYGDFFGDDAEVLLDGEPVDAENFNNADQFDRSFSLVDDVAGDESDAIAEFRQINIGFYVQDDIQVTEDFSLTAGLRFDIPIWPTDLPTNPSFNDETVPLLEAAGYDLRGAGTGSFISPSLLISPRVGFTYDVTGDNTTQLRGGAGIFTSRIPLVWPGGAYNNYGLNVGGVRRFGVPFTGDVNNQPFQPDLTNLTPSGQIDLFAEDFKLPQVLKFNAAVDQLLPGGFVGTFEAVFSKNFNSPLYESLNLQPSTENLEGGPDTRPLFNVGDEIDDRYTGIYLASNTNKGYAYNIAATVSKQFSEGLQANVGYTWGDSYSLFDGTSSQNSSQWRGYYNPAGRNEELDDPQRSFFATGHRVFAQASYALEYAGGFRTKLSLFYNGQSGNPYTYVVGASNRNFVNDGGFSFNEVIYVPATQSDINLVDATDRDGNVTATAAEQWAALDAFIENDPYLSENRGQYAERNGNFAPFEHQLDLRILQDFGLTVGDKRHAFQVSLDVLNVLNLLNENWGKVYNTGFGTYAPIFLEDLEGGTVPTYTVAQDILDDPGFVPFTDNLVTSGRIRSSRWTGQLGLRYIFE